MVFKLNFADGKIEEIVMKRFFKKMMLVTAVLITSTGAIAANEQGYCGSDGRLCLSSEDIIKEVVKETVSTVGKHLLDRYVTGDGLKQIKNSINNEQAAPVNNPSNAATTAANSTTQAVIVESSEASEAQTAAQTTVSQSTSGSEDLIILD